MNIEKPRPIKVILFILTGLDLGMTMGESPWTEEPGSLQSMGSQKVGHRWATKHIAHGIQPCPIRHRGSPLGLLWKILLPDKKREMRRNLISCWHTCVRARAIAAILISRGHLSWMNVMHYMSSRFICVWLCAILCQAPLPMGFSRQEYWNGLPCPSPGNLSYPGIEPRSPALQVGSLPSESLGKPSWMNANGLQRAKKSDRNILISVDTLHHWIK